VGGVIRTFVYVDGFNLYYGALKGTPYKWLDIVQLTNRILPSEYSIQKLKYFTARVSGSVDSGAPARQQAYLSALREQNEIEIHFGSFLTKSIWRPIINLPIADAVISSENSTVLKEADYIVTGGTLRDERTLPVKNYITKGTANRKRHSKPKAPANSLVVEVHTMEEKGSDVNLAAHLLNDAWKESFDAAVVFSNDTDLITPISMVTIEQKKPVFVVSPGRAPMAVALQRVATYKRHLRGSLLACSQFPDQIPDTTIRKPANW